MVGEARCSWLESATDILETRGPKSTADYVVHATPTGCTDDVAISACGNVGDLETVRGTIAKVQKFNISEAAQELQELMDLHDDSEKMSWPSGMNPMKARQWLSEQTRMGQPDCYGYGNQFGSHVCGGAAVHYP